MSILDIITDYLEEHQNNKVFINTDISSKFEKALTMRITGSSEKVFINDMQELLIQFLYKSTSYIETEEMAEIIDELLLNAPVLSNDKYEIYGFVNKTALFDQDVIDEYYYKTALYKLFICKK